MSLEIKTEFQTNGIPLKKYYGYASDENLVKEFLNFREDVEGKLARDEPVYVQVMDQRRRGAVGRLSKVEFTYVEPTASSGSYWGRSRNSHYTNIHDIEVVWDGRKNKCQPWITEVEYLPHWSGGTQWAWTPGEAKERPPRVIPHDHLNQEITEGQFVCFVHRLYGEVSMKFGSVTRLTDKGGVYVKTLKMRDEDAQGSEVKALASKDLIIVNDQLMSRLVMARLAAQ